MSGHRTFLGSGTRLFGDYEASPKLGLVERESFDGDLELLTYNIG